MKHRKSPNVKVQGHKVTWRGKRKHLIGYIPQRHPI